jgi:hypothetical protein
MKWPKVNFSLPKIFQRKIGEIKLTSFYRTWKKFVSQIPREFRSLTKQHQHFIVLGDEKSGKSELIHGIVEQSQNIYPFEVEYTKDLNVQFYMGPKQLIQELSVAMVRDRTIVVRKSLIHLWKKLYSKNSPIIVIAYHCWSALSKDSREVSKAARTIAGKLALLSEIANKPLKIRVALTHLDKIEGYLEFTSFIKQHNINVEIPIASNFESQALQHALYNFRDKYISLILTSVSAEDFQKILLFFDELPKFFAGIEEYLRALMTGNIPGQFELEKLTFTTKLEPYTAFTSFDWKAPESNSIFFRHPMLKHQIASAAVFVTCAGLIMNNFFKDKLQVNLTEKGVDSLDYLQPKVFVDEVIPKIEDLINNRPKEGYLPILPRFYNKQLRDTNQNLSMRIRKHILEPGLRKIMLQDQQEIKILYMLGLIYATQKNRLGEHITKNIYDWSHVLGLDEKLIRNYINSNIDNTSNRIEIEHLEKINAVGPLSSSDPWISFLRKFQDIIDQPVFTGHNFESLRTEATQLLNEYRRIKNDTHGFVICNLLGKVNSRMLSDFARNIKILGWLKLTGDYLESFLVFVCHSCPEIPDISDHNVSQFFAKIKDITSLNDQIDTSYNFLLGDEKFSFQTKKWVTLSVAHVVERLIQNYIVVNNETKGEIFFKHTPDIPPLVIESYRNEFPHFDEPIVIEGRYTRLAFEKNVRYTTESLLALLETVPLNEEDKERFRRFLKQEVVSYAKQYQLEYERLYSACNIKSSTLDEVKTILEKIVEPSSSFQHFLKTMNYHTEVFSNPPECLSALEEMNHFNFLRVLMNQVKNKSTPFEKYQALLRQVLARLSDHSESRNYTNVANLEDVITPSATVTLSILRNDPDSYLNQIKENLSDIGVPPAYHHLFTAPIMQIYYLGVKDLKKGIDRVWAESLEPHINQLFAKRPFNSESEMISTFEEVKKVTNPTCEVWSVLKQIIAPVSITVDGLWEPKLSCDLKLDSALYNAVNRLAKVSNILWDNEGNPQPIRMNVQSLPFEAGERAYPLPVLSYLVTGDEAYHNFNQNPSWHLISIEWWKANNSTVVLELANKNDSRTYRDTKVLNSPWSFFELLKKAEQKEENVWQWALGSQLSEKVSHVALKFEDNPWGLFQPENQRIN